MAEMHVLITKAWKNLRVMKEAKVTKDWEEFFKEKTELTQVMRKLDKYEFDIQDPSVYRVWFPLYTQITNYIATHKYLK